MRRYNVLRTSVCISQFEIKELVTMEIEIPSNALTF